MLEYTTALLVSHKLHKNTVNSEKIVTTLWNCGEIAANRVIFLNSHSTIIAFRN